jgi:hypothetical protein
VLGPHQGLIRAIVSIGLVYHVAYNADHSIEDMLARIQQWLEPPDPLLNLRKSLKLRSTETGKWYLQGSQYEAWKGASAPPFTWLHGSPGSGKTILSAGIVNDLQEYCKDDPARSLGFFFFDFDDVEKQDPTNMVKSLLSQFLGKCARVPEVVQALHAACENGRRQASEQQFIQALKHTIELLPAPFIVLDALDECCSRDRLYDILEQMKDWGMTTLRVLVTSRKEVEIEEALEGIVLPDNETGLESHLVDKDIQTYVRKRLATDKSFRRWKNDEEIQGEIERTLGRKAHGMYSPSQIRSGDDDTNNGPQVQMGSMSAGHHSPMRYPWQGPPRATRLAKDSRRDLRAHPSHDR